MYIYIKLINRILTSKYLDKLYACYSYLEPLTLPLCLLCYHNNSYYFHKCGTRFIFERYITRFSVKLELIFCIASSLPDIEASEFKMFAFIALHKLSV